MSSQSELTKQHDINTERDELMQHERMQVMISAKSIAAIASLTTRRYSLEHVLDIIDNHLEALRTSLVCLSTTRNLLTDARALLQKAMSFPDPSAQYAFSVSFNEFLHQMDQIISEASFNEKNLLRGDDLKVFFDQEGRSSFLIKGVDITSQGMNLELLDPSSADDRVFHNKILELDAALKHLNIHSALMESALTILSSRRTFALKISNDLDDAARAITRDKILNAPARNQNRLLLGHSSNNSIQLTNGNLNEAEFTSISPQTQMPVYTPMSPHMPLTAATNEAFSSAVHHEFETYQSEALQKPLAKERDKSFKKKSLFSLFKSDKGSETEGVTTKQSEKVKKEKRKKAIVGIGPILKRLREGEPEDIHHELAPNVPQDFAQGFERDGEFENTPETPLHTFAAEQQRQYDSTQQAEQLQHFAHHTQAQSQNMQLPEALARQLENMNSISADIMRYLDGERFEQLWPLYQSGDYCVYIRELSGRIHIQKQDLINLYFSDLFIQRALHNFEISFHKLVKEEHHHSSLSVEQSIKHWLNSAYGEPFKVIFSICRMNNSEQSPSLGQRLEDMS